MKPKRYFRHPLFLAGTIRYGAPVIAGFAIFISGSALGGIYGGAPGSGGATPQPGTAPISGTAPTASDTTRANALQALQRTAQAVGAAKALQDAAAAAATGNNAGANPNNPSQTLPNVPDGLGNGGLQPVAGATPGTTNWQGAELPTEAISNGLSTVTVRQTAQQALLTWQTFNVGKNTTLNFDQSAGGSSASQWIAFNKVTDTSTNPSQILGRINAQGQVYIINPNGIIFGGSSQINVGGLTATSLPVNATLIANGLLNNPTQQFLFDGLGHNTRIGDVTVHAGAALKTSVSADGNGGRISLIGANVTNSGTLNAANGQVILAAGLQVGVAAHAGTDPSLRGLDVYVGAVTDPASALSPYAGTVTNNGIIEIARASATLTGKTVLQNGVIDSTTSVSLNGRIDLLANYGAIANTGYKSDLPSTGNPFLFRETGNVTLGQDSVTRILPETGSTETTIGTELALRSQINLQGRTVHVADGSTILAPNAIVNVNAGAWNYIPSSSLPTSTFLHSLGQVYLDAGALINLAGTVDATASVTQNLLTLELRGSELSVAPVQRDGELRGETITVDLGVTGEYEGRFWVGTPLADLTGYVGLVQRNVGQLTTAGGTLNLSSGGSIVVQNGATIDVSGGWTNFTSGMVSTTQLVSNGRLVDISKALPGVVYDGIYSPRTNVVHSAWGVTESYGIGIIPNGPRLLAGYTSGAAGGTLNLTAPSMALDGTLTGHTSAGENQIRNSTSSSSLPPAATLNIRFQSQLAVGSTIYTNYPTPPSIVFEDDHQATPVAAFTTDASGNPAALSAERRNHVSLSPSDLAASGFGNLSVSNPGGSITVPAGTDLNLGAGSSITFTSSNIVVAGNITAAGGSLAFNVHNISPYDAARAATVGTGTILPLNPGMGVFTLADGATLSTAGLIVDGRDASTNATPLAIKGGNISIRAYSADLAQGSVIEASGGYFVSATGAGKYGNGGAISIAAGQDLSQPVVIGGTLNLGATLKGYSGVKGASLTLQSGSVQIGGTAPGGDNLHLDPSFFTQGGFGSYSIVGLASQGNRPALLVADGTVIEPTATQLRVIPSTPGTPLSLDVGLYTELETAYRTPVSIGLSAPGVNELTGSELAHRGDAVIGAGSVIRTEPGASISVTGNTVTVLGSLIAPGGSIAVGGGSSTANVFKDHTQARITTHIGSQALLSAAGTVVYLPDANGLRRGTVLNGGSITLSGNIAAEDGAVLDVSGTSATLDLKPYEAAPVGTGTPSRSIAGTSPLLPDAIATSPVKVDSNGGTITLRGGQYLASDATLLGNAGGSTAQGGTLAVSSGFYFLPGTIPPASTVNLHVTQTGDLVSGSVAVGSTLGNAGHFKIDSFSSGGFDSLSLGGSSGGVVSFDGAVQVDARGSIRVGSGGYLFANSRVDLSATYIHLGQDLKAPVLPEDANLNPLSTPSTPTYGTGSIHASADLIDLGSLSLKNIGSLNLTAANGDIRGSGTVHIAGTMNLTAGQIYPTTASTLNLIAYNSAGGPGTININASGTRSLPWSAGGTLNVHAEVIRQAGTLRAPFGVIQLGWDGTGTAPIDLITGAAMPVTKSLTLASGSTTSVSAVDPLTGQALVLPYGTTPDGEKWIDPRGVDITTSGPPQKAIVLSSASISTETGSTIDLRGGGDLYAERFVSGLGGITDILALSGRFAVVPGYDSDFAPVLDYNQSNSANNLIDGLAGYSSEGLKVGDKVYLSASSGLPAGYYTLLPARYALLPGGVLVTPTGNTAAGNVSLPDGSTLVSGYRYNSLNGERTLPTLATQFEVASAATFRQRALYEDYSANTFLTNRAAALNTAVPLLPRDSGQLVFQASQALDLGGSVLSASVSPAGRGGIIDISTQLDIVIGGSGAPAGSVFLDAAKLSAYGAESLLIGGRRTRDNSGTSTVQVNTGNLTVNNTGTALSASDLVLVAKNQLTIADGSQISSTGTATTAESILVSGNGALLRVSAAKNASVTRTGVTTATNPILTIGSGATITGGTIIADSSSRLNLSSAASLDAASFAFGAGRISLLLDQSGALGADPGLVLDQTALLDFRSAESLSLVSYSSIDLYGQGTIGSSALKRLSLDAGEIRNINLNGGQARVVAGNLSLGNRANASAGAVSTSAGSLVFDASIINLTAGKLTLNGAGNSILTTGGGVTSTASGELAANGDLTISTPLLTGGAGLTRTISATGALSVQGRAATTTAPAAALGATLRLNGASVTTNADILLPSGAVSLTATNGAVNVNGLIDVSGIRRVFADAIQYTNGGNISLSSTTGNVVLGSAASLDLSAEAGGGSAGTLAVSTPAGSLTTGGRIVASAGAGGNTGSFLLDTASLPLFSGLGSFLTNSDLTLSQSIRVRNGDVIIDGTARAKTFTLSADSGSITVTGTVDASGTHGGEITLSANKNLTLESGSVLNARGATFSSSGKGGKITLEAGTQSNGIVGTGTLDLRTGSTIDLSVASKVAGTATTTGSSAFNGQFSGTLHLRAPRNTAGTDISVAALGSTIIDPSALVVEGYKVYDLTSSGGLITTAVQNQIRTEAASFLGSAGSASAAYNSIYNRLTSLHPSLGSMLVLAPGAEIINRTGDLTLGTTSTTNSADWDLSGFRFGEKSAAGILTLRAAGNLVFYNSISDGFTPTRDPSEPIWLWTARLSTANPLLPVNAQSWSYRLTAGADLSASDFTSVRAQDSLATDKGDVILGKTGTSLTAESRTALTENIISSHYQVIRTGSGDITINAARDIQLRNQLAAIYSAGTRVTNPAINGSFITPIVSTASQNDSSATDILGSIQQGLPALYTMAGSDVVLKAGRNIEHVTLSGGSLVADSSLQMPTNWLYRRGEVDSNGAFTTGRFPDNPNATTWWVDFSNFFQSVGALGGGNVTLQAGNNISNVDAVAPTNARAWNNNGTVQLLELGGGDVTVRAGNNIDAGVYYVERGAGILSAGGQILTNGTRSVLTQSSINAGQSSAYTQLPTTLFLGKGSFDVSASGDLLIGPVANPFLLPQGINNSYWYKTAFSTYAEESEVRLSSLGGNVTVRTSSTSPGEVAGEAQPLLQSWYTNKLLLSNQSASMAKPWLRLSESSVVPFATAFSIMPASLQVTAFSGNIALAGNLLLSPSGTGNIELFAAGAIHALQPNGIVSINGTRTTTWGTSRIIVSDADPSLIPSPLKPIGRPNNDSVSAGTAASTPTNPSLLDNFDRLFAESGGTVGLVLETKQSLHAPRLLHRGDTSPVRLYAGTGDISGLTLFSPKSALVYAGRDISDASFYIQNLATGDVSVITAGRDILPYRESSLLRVASAFAGNTVNLSAGPLAGDIQISGPGTLQVIAGRSIDLGTGANKADGTGSGITSIGNTRNPYLPVDGANLFVAAGLTSSGSLAASQLHLDDFIAAYVETAKGAEYIEELAPGTDFATLGDEERARLAVEVFYLILRDAGRSYASSGNYDSALAAIATLFGTDRPVSGNIQTRSRDIRTTRGGNIDILTPGGGLELASSTFGNTLSPPGIITESGGNISIFAKDDISIGIGRIFTLRGGNEVIWSSDGNIAAGSSSKTVASAPPTRVVIDPQSAAVQTDLAGLATGGGIGVLATVAGVKPGNVDLIAPNGFVDAGDAGIRSAGNLNISANQVLNAGNISTGGTSTGTPVAVSVSTSIGGLNTATNTTTPPAATTSQAPPPPPVQQEIPTEDLASSISVEVIGYGGTYDDEDDEEEKRRKREAEEAAEAPAEPPAPGISQ